MENKIADGRRKKGGTRGRKPKHPFPLNDTDQAAVLATLRNISQESNFTLSSLVNELIEFGNSGVSLKGNPFVGYDDDIFHTNTSTISEVIKNGFGSRDGLAKAFLLLFSSNHYKNIFEKEKNIESMKLNEPFVQAAHNLLGGSDFDKPDIAGRFKGIYELYRPSPFNPNEEGFCCRLTVGSKPKHPFDCLLETTNPDDPQSDIHAVGKIIPLQEYAQQLSIVLSVPHTGSQFYIHFEDVTHYPATGKKEMHGIMLAAFGSKPASAWPVYALSTPDSGKPALRRFKLSEAGTFPAAAREQFDRGAVHWHPDFYPKKPT